MIVAAPDDLHYPITMAALDAGLHVLCEHRAQHDQRGLARPMCEVTRCEATHEWSPSEPEHGDGE